MVRSYSSVGSRFAPRDANAGRIVGRRSAHAGAFDLAVVVWVTDALDDAVGAVVIAALMAVLLDISPNVADPNVPTGVV